MSNAALDLREMVVFLAATGVVLPFMHRLRISPIIGFVGIGLLLSFVHARRKKRKPRPLRPALPSRF